MKLQKERLPSLIFIFTLFVFAAIAWFSFQRLNKLIASTLEVSAINSTRLEIKELLLNITEAESSQRGYLLSGDSLFLKQYFHHVSVADREFIKIRMLLSDADNKQLQTFTRLDEFVKRRF